MCRPVMVPIVLASLFLFSAVGRGQGPSRQKSILTPFTGCGVSIKRVRMDLKFLRTALTMPLCPHAHRGWEAPTWPH